MDGTKKKKNAAPSRNVTLLGVGYVRAESASQNDDTAQHVGPHMARGLPLLKARLT